MGSRDVGLSPLCIYVLYMYSVYLRWWERRRGRWQPCTGKGEKQLQRRPWCRWLRSWPIFHCDRFSFLSWLWQISLIDSQISLTLYRLIEIHNRHMLKYKKFIKIFYFLSVVKSSYALKIYQNILVYKPFPCLLSYQNNQIERN